MANKKRKALDFENFDDDYDEDERFIPVSQRDVIPQFPIQINNAAIHVDGPENITKDSTFDDVQDNDLKLHNMLMVAALHAISNVRTPKSFCMLSKEMRELTRARRDCLLMQKEKEPTLSGKGAVFNCNPID